MSARRGRGRRRPHEVHKFVAIARQLEAPHGVLLACHYGPRYGGCSETEVHVRPPAVLAVMPQPARKGADR